MDRGSQALPDWAGDGLQSHSHFTKLGFSIGVCIQNYKAIYRNCPTAQPARDSPIQQPARCLPEPAPPQGSGPLQLIGTAKESKQTSFSPPLQSIPVQFTSPHSSPHLIMDAATCPKPGADRNANRSLRPHRKRTSTQNQSTRYPLSWPCRPAVEGPHSSRTRAGQALRLCQRRSKHVEQAATHD